MTEGLSKSERMRSERCIDALFSGGKRGYVHPLKYCWVGTPTADWAAQNGKALHGEDNAAVSVLVSVPKKAFKRAWKRNLIKRRIKESYRRRKHFLAEKTAAAGGHIDIAFICAPGEIPDYKTIDNAIARILEQIMERS